MIAVEKVTRHLLVHPNIERTRIVYLVTAEGVRIECWIAGRLRERLELSLVDARNHYRQTRDVRGYQEW